MKIFCSLCLLVLLSVLVSCGDNATSPNKNLEIYPLSIGNSWSFIAIDNYNSKIDTTTGEATISRDTIIDGVKFYSIDDSETWMTNKSDGLYGFELGETTLKIKYPAKIGDTMPSGFGDNKMVVTSLNASVTTKAGTFKCIKYATDITNGKVGDADYYHLLVDMNLCPGVGMIKFSTIEEQVDSYSSSIQELTSYTIK